MRNLFKPKAPIDSDEFDWLIACFRWLLDDLDSGKPEALAHSRLYTLEDLLDGLDNGLRDHDLAEAIFARTKRLCGMEKWPCQLRSGSTGRESKVQPGLAIKHEIQPPLGQFSSDDTGVVISYDPALLASPEKLVATFSHELAHFLLAGKSLPPGGPELLEHATDCAAVYLGFGVFMTNSAFEFRQFSNFEETGWEMKASGYLSELALTVATALSVHFSQANPEIAETRLKEHLRKPFRKAMKAVVQRFPNGASGLSEVDLGDWK